MLMLNFLLSIYSFTVHFTDFFSSVIFSVSSAFIVVHIPNIVSVYFIVHEC